MNDDKMQDTFFVLRAVPFMIWGEGRNEVQIDPLLPPTYIFFAPQLTPYNILQNLTTNWVGVRLPPTYIFGDPLLTPTYIFNFIPTPPPDQKWNSPDQK